MSTGNEIQSSQTLRLETPPADPLKAMMASGVMPSIDPANPLRGGLPSHLGTDWTKLPYSTPQEKTWAIACSQLEIESIAKRLGLDMYPQRYAMVDFDQMNQIAARGGFPRRYPSWRFGMEYQQLSEQYAYGLGKIYEMVINNDACWGYLLDCNSLTAQQMVIAHVCGHNDFFKNNIWFARTPKNMLDRMGDHAAIVQGHIDKLGVDKVEEFINTCMMIEDLIDPYSEPKPGTLSPYGGLEEDTEKPIRAPKFKVDSPYMDRFINPPELLEAEEKRLKLEREKSERRHPPAPERDVLMFLLENAPLKPWQKDILEIFHRESCYFRPQGQTKVMNEGWASYWHYKIMTEFILQKDERGLIEFATMHAGTMFVAPGGFNPYKLGFELFRDIEDRWNRGAFGEEYEMCRDIEQRKKWDRKLNLGMQKIFEVAHTDNDITFLDQFLTPEFCARQKMFTFTEDEQHNLTIVSREFPKIKQQLLRNLTNMGRPIIRVVDANWQNRAELALEHQVDGRDLKVPWAIETLKALQTIWSRPVHVLTTFKDKKRRMTFDGQKFEIKEL